jgi:hypothetical protein
MKKVYQLMPTAEDYINQHKHFSGYIHALYACITVYDWHRLILNINCLIQTRDAVEHLHYKTDQVNLRSIRIASVCQQTCSRKVFQSICITKPTVLLIRQEKLELS